MSRYDPVRADDLLIEALLRGDVADDPVLSALDDWRTSLDAAELAEEPRAASSVADLDRDPGRVVPLHGADRTSGGRRRQDHRAPTAPRRTARASAVAVSAAVAALTMGVSQAVAGNPVAPLQFVVNRAVGIGEDIGSPRAADTTESAPASPTDVGSVGGIGGRAGADALDERSPASDGAGSQGDGGDNADGDVPGTKPRVRDFEAAPPGGKPDSPPGGDLDAPPRLDVPPTPDDSDRWWNWRDRDDGSSRDDGRGRGRGKDRRHDADAEKRDDTGANGRRDDDKSARGRAGSSRGPVASPRTPSVD